MDPEGLMDESWQDGPEVTSPTSLRLWLFRVPSHGSAVDPGTWEKAETPPETAPPGPRPSVCLPWGDGAQGPGWRGCRELWAGVRSERVPFHVLSGKRGFKCRPAQFRSSWGPSAELAVGKVLWFPSGTGTSKK